MRKFTLSVLAVFLAFASLAAQSVNSEAQSKLRSAENIIENFYVDEVNADTLVTEAIKAMLKTLDPHSLYSTPEETRELDEPLQGNFSGIGVTFNMQSDTVYIIQPTVGGPSERVGILPGDRIIKADGVDISGVKMSRKDIMKRLRGPKGTQVKLSVKRGGEPALIDFVVVRDDIPIYSVDASYMVDPTTGYIRLTRFAEETPGEIEKAITSLKKQGMKNLMLDLQDNGGGYLLAATDLADMFLRKGDKVLFTQSSKQKPRYYITGSDGAMTDGRVVVLVNQYSASASEILSGALQDNDRGVIVGRRTFGKGLVQRPFRFNDGSMMRLTIARYYTPSGRCIQKPYTDGSDDSYQKDMDSRLKSGELMNAENIHFDESQLFHTRAGRPVYGGGGIMPDRFVPLDTTFFTNYYRDLVAKGVVNKYTINYVDNHRKALKSTYPTEADFIRDFTVTPAMMKDFIALGEKEEVKYDAAQYELSRAYLEAVIKAIIGRDLFDQATYYKIMNPLNPVYTEAYRLAADPVEYQRLLRPSKKK